MANNRNTRNRKDENNEEMYSGKDRKGAARSPKRYSKRNPSRERNNSKSYDRLSTVPAIQGSDNDPAWYRTLPELTDAAARFPFSRPLGTPINWGDFSNLTVKLDDAFPSALPGIMTLSWSPMVGLSTEANSPVNVASRQIYSYVRHANSGHVNYDSPDLMIYLLSMDSIYSLYTAAVRAYGLANMYTSANRYMPKALITALGWDFDDIISNQAQFRTAINNICYKISSFNVPNFMSYFLRHIWMNSFIYTDKASAKAQMYAYKQVMYYQYQANVHETNFAGLTAVNITSDTLWTVQEWVEIMNGLIDPILASEDFGIMSGDILKAFGIGNLFSVVPVPIDYTITPTYNVEVLSQIQNATPIGSVIDYSNDVDSVYYTNDIVQAITKDTWIGYLYTNPLVGSNAATTAISTKYTDSVMLPRLITSDSESPTVDEVMVSTRLSNVPDKKITVADAPTRYGWSEAQTFSSELLNFVNLYYLKDGEIRNVSIGPSGLYFDYEDESDSLLKFALHLLSKFDWAPTFPICTRFNGGNATFNGWYQDTNNYTLLLTDDLTQVHQAALMSMFYVPLTGSYSHKPLKE